MLDGHIAFQQRTDLHGRRRRGRNPNEEIEEIQERRDIHLEDRSDVYLFESQVDNARHWWSIDQSADRSARACVCVLADRRRQRRSRRRRRRSALIRLTSPSFDWKCFIRSDESSTTSTSERSTWIDSCEDVSKTITYRRLISFYISLQVEQKGREREREHDQQIFVEENKSEK